MTDPVDFTKPEAFAQSGAKLADHATPGAQQASSLMGWLIALRDRLSRRRDSAQAASISMQGGAAPIEFSGGPPEDATEASAAEAREAALEAEAARIAAARRPARPVRSRLLLWIVLAPLSWLAFAILLSTLDSYYASFSLVDNMASPDFFQPMSDPAFVARVLVLARNMADLLYWPVLVLMGLTLLLGLFKTLAPRRSMAASDSGYAPPGRLSMLVAAVLNTIKVVPKVATACAVLGALVAGLAFLNNDNHWDSLPWVYPPYVETFIARHPDLAVGEIDSRSRKRVVRDAKGRSIGLQGFEMDGAQLSFAPCPAKLGAEQLGGIPPYPGIACASVATLRSKRDTQTHYQFQQASGSDSQAILAHFQAWADKHAGGSALSETGGKQFSYSASARTDDWKLRVESSKGLATTIVIEQHQGAVEPEQPAPTPGKAAIKLKIAN